MATDHFKKALDLARIRSAKTGTIQSKKVATFKHKKSLHENENSSFTAIKYQKTQVQPVSHEYLRKNRVIAGFTDQQNSSQFRILRTQILQKLKENDWNTLAITSAHCDAGKSLVASNLAVSLSMLTNITVLLVDLDLRNPSIHKYFDINTELGIYDHLAGNTPIENILVNPGISRLVVLPGSKPVQNSSEILASSQTLELLDEIKNRYKSRIILYDLPPLVGIDDAMVVLPKIDTSILVVEANKTTAHDITQAMQVLEKHHLLGFVFNKADKLDVKQYGY